MHPAPRPMPPTHGAALRRMTLAALATLWLAAAGCGAGRHETSVGPGAAGTEVVGAAGDALGQVDLPTSCDPAAQVHLERGLALLHHMNYLRAETVFLDAAEADPECALAYWGLAMSQVHPLWPDTVSAERRAAGEALLASAAARHTSSREAMYVEALKGYYRGEERGEGDRLTSFLAGWSAVHAAFPGDAEAAAFHALALLGAVAAEDKSYRNQLAAGTILEGVLERMPRHPGAYHYTIHAYDFPPLAERALDVARRYDDLAPENTHALHMTSHIFTRLGLWGESIELNRRAAAAALERTPAGEISMHRLHALDYLAYALLQVGDEAAAEGVAAELGALEPPFQDHAGSAYAFAAVPARLALERRDWELAAALPVRRPLEVLWERYPHLEAIPWFARALGAARSGRPAEARPAIAELARLEEAARALDGAYDWGTQVAIQRLAAEGWTAWASGELDRALELAAQAAEAEGATEKSPVTPGEVLPARELYGDLLLAAGRADDALAAYRATLERSPNRYNSLYGAGRAAEVAGETEIAASYYARLLESCPRPTGDPPGLEHARRYLGRDAKTAR